MLATHDIPVFAAAVPDIDVAPHLLAWAISAVVKPLPVTGSNGNGRTSCENAGAVLPFPSRIKSTAGAHIAYRSRVSPAATPFATLRPEDVFHIRPLFVVPDTAVG